MQQQRRSLSSLASFSRKRISSRAASVYCDALRTTLSATNCPVAASRAFHTVEKCPQPTLLHTV